MGVTGNSLFKFVDPPLTWTLIQARVYEVERVSNRTYASGEHFWESNATFSVAHVSTTVSSLVLFFSQALVHTPVSTVQVQLQRQSIP